MPDDASLQRAARQAKARAEYLSAVARAKQRQQALQRFLIDGSFAIAKTIKRAGQVVIPKDIIERWADSPSNDVDVILLDFRWGVLVMPASEARRFLADLDLEQEMLKRSSRDS